MEKKTKRTHAHLTVAKHNIFLHMIFDKFEYGLVKHKNVFQKYLSHSNLIIHIISQTKKKMLILNKYSPIV